MNESITKINIGSCWNSDSRSNVGDSDVSLFHVRRKTENITLSFFISLFFFSLNRALFTGILSP